MKIDFKGLELMQMQMQELEKLEQFLDKNLYGQGVAKSWQSLVEEIEAGECQIVWSGNSPIRVVKVLKIKVIAAAASEFPGAQLYEAYQEFSDGRRRERNLSGLSEKIKPGEDLDKAVTRAIEEELGIKGAEIAIEDIELDPRFKIEEKQSPSYPGLVTRYVFYNATVFLDTKHVKPQYEEIQPDKKTVFVWR